MCSLLCRLLSSCVALYSVGAFLWVTADAGHSVVLCTGSTHKSWQAALCALLMHNGAAVQAAPCFFHTDPACMQKLAACVARASRSTRLVDACYGTSMRVMLPATFEQHESLPCRSPGQLLGDFKASMVHQAVLTVAAAAANAHSVSAQHVCVESCEL